MPKFSDGSLPQVCFVGSGNKILVSTYFLVLVRTIEILVASPCHGSFEDQAAAATARLITLVGLLLMLSGAVPDLRIREGVTVPARFGFVVWVLEPCCSLCDHGAASTCSMGFFSSLQVWISGFSFVCEEVWCLIAGRSCSRMELSSFFGSCVFRDPLIREGARSLCHWRHVVHGYYDAFRRV